MLLFYLFLLRLFFGKIVCFIFDDFLFFKKSFYVLPLEGWIFMNQVHQLIVSISDVFKFTQQLSLTPIFHLQNLYLVNPFYLIINFLTIILNHSRIQVQNLLSCLPKIPSKNAIFSDQSYNFHIQCFLDLIKVSSLLKGRSLRYLITIFIHRIFLLFNFGDQFSDEIQIFQLKLIIQMQLIKFFFDFQKELFIIQLTHRKQQNQLLQFKTMAYKAIQMIQAHLQEELLEAYELFDNRGKGYIDANGLIENMKELGYEIDKRQVAQMIEFLDQSGKNIITKEAFLKFMTARLDFRDQPEDLKQSFEFLDQAGKGIIRMIDIQRMAEQLGESKEECRRIMAEADKDDDNTLNWEEYMRVIKKTSQL